MKKSTKKIVFEELFELSLKKRAINFLESGTPTATLTKGILITAAIGGVLAVGVMAPNLFRAFGVRREERNTRLNKEGFRRVRRGVYQLRSQHLIHGLYRHFSGGIGRELGERCGSLVKYVPECLK